MKVLIFLLFFIALIMLIMDGIGIIMCYMNKKNIFSEILSQRIKDKSNLSLKVINVALLLIGLLIAFYFFKMGADIYALVILILIHGANSFFERVLKSS